MLNEQLVRLAALYPEAGHNDKTLRVTAKEWAELLDAWEASGREFMDALTVVKTRCNFFPKPADLKSALDWIREHPPRVPESHRLPEYTFGHESAERREKTQKAIDIITAQLTKKITPDEAARRIAALGFR